MTLDEQQFRTYLRRGGRSEPATDRCLALVKQFIERPGAAETEPLPTELARYVGGLESEASAKRMLWALIYYFNFANQPAMAEAARKLRRERIARSSLPLRGLLGVDQTLLHDLAEAGINDTRALLDAMEPGGSLDPISSREWGDLAALEDLRQLCRFCLIRGVGSVRSRLYRDSIGSIEQLARLDSRQLIATAASYISSTGFDGVPPTAREASFTVHEARRLASGGTEIGVEEG